MHRTMCCRRQGDVRPIEWVEIDYDLNVCSGKNGCLANCDFDSLGETKNDS